MNLSVLRLLLRPERGSAATLLMNPYEPSRAFAAKSTKSEST